VSTLLLIAKRPRVYSGKVPRFPNGRLLLTLVLGVLLEPVGHAAAYVLRYGPTEAWQLQSQGGHAYFPRVLSFSSVSLAVLLSLGLLTAVSIRLILGSRRPYLAGLPTTFGLLALTQCAFFCVKETMEAAAVQARPDFLAIGLLAVVVQLPLAALAAWVMTWLRGYLRFAPEAIRTMLAVRLAVGRSPHLIRPLAVPVLTNDLRDRGWYRRRGPPLSR
jgi:hypothetical protein